MAEGTVTKRLSKVARELGVGVSTIVDFLSGKGFEVDSNPNAKIGGEAYDMVLSEFQSDKAAQDKSRQMSQSKVVRETISLENTEKKDTRKPAEQEEVMIRNIENIASPDRNIIKPKIEEKKPKVVDKIDLDSINTSTRPVKKEEAAPAEEKPKEAEPAKEVETPKAEAPAEEKTAEKTEAPKAPEKPAEPEAPKKEAEEKPAPVAPAAAVAPTTDAAPKEEAKAKPEAKPEEKKPKEDDKFTPEDSDGIVKVNVKKLAGPTVVGKIDLPAKKVPSKPKPVASSSDSDIRPKKKKRKRITPAGGQGGNSGGNSGNSSNAGQKRGKPGGAGGNKRTPKPELTEAQIQNQIRETLARLSGGGKSKGSKYRRAKRDAASAQAQEEAQQQEDAKSVLKATEFVTVNELATMMDVQVTEVISACMSLGMFVSINQRLDKETLSIVAEEFGYSVDFVSEDINAVTLEEEDNPEEIQSRPPIVTVMGHVDHGKTSLLDYIRNANVISGEAGGITQHIGAYSVELEDGKSMTFLDTPGHEAFTAMRARGAQVTDVVIIVIAADDNVMPQTKEAINHAQAANVPIVFALNKIDTPNANPDRIKEELSSMNILVEEWGGKYQCQEISAKKGTNISELLEKVLLEAELLELKADPKKRASGTVIESLLDKGRGYVTTILVEGGTLEVGDMILAGPYFGKVKAMHNERGQTIEKAGPSTPVSILGFNGAPSAGDKFHMMDDEREAKTIATKRLQLQREQGVRTQKVMTLDEIGRRLAIGDFQELNVIVKGDVDGSVEALSDSLLKNSTEKIQVNIISKSVGQITESDVLLATASSAIIIGFQVRPSAGSRKLAEKEGIEIRTYSVIYDAIDDVKLAMEGMLKPKLEEKIVCNIEVRETFKISKVGTIAGCYVLDGTVHRNTKIRLIRDGVVVHTGELGSLKRFKDDVKEVRAGYECGLNIHNYNDIKVDDIIEGFEQVEVKQSLND